ncbi:hypothetical protein GJ700_30200 [Duganella sp. FT92W]|uniref:Tetratricopeptide repeat protein n=1 Tax=Pseudoduganella rivuli TaxID=2666085 RepID=A0A7X2IU71_9BURK|nr:hypothetical protein [Pseudoduganella rivuli]MRV75994.1 hypothetical protein [Pseudoduganella rivuli]
MTFGYEAQSEAEPLTPEQEASLRQIYLKQAPVVMAQYANAQNDYEAFTFMARAAAAAFHLAQFDEARQLAERALALAPSYRDDWNYGNAIHLGHTVLGLLALQSGDAATAIAELHASGDTPGSPQLLSFGPTMHLAKSLLKAGHVTPVLEYLQQCRVFWRMAGVWPDLWEQKIRAGGIPNFFQHCFV